MQMHKLAFLSCLLLGLQPDTKLLWYHKTGFSLLMGLWSTHSSFQLILESFNTFTSSLVSERSRSSISRASYRRAQCKYKRTDSVSKPQAKGFAYRTSKSITSMFTAFKSLCYNPCKGSSTWKRNEGSWFQIDYLGYASLMQRHELRSQLSQQFLCFEFERGLFYSHSTTGDICSA